MNVSDTGIALVKKWEGFGGTAYKCAAGVWTLGYGHTGTYNGRQIHKGMTITKEEAHKLLVADLEKFAAYVRDDKYVPFTAQLNQNQFDVLVSFAFNCGANNLKALCQAPRTMAEVSAKLPAYCKAAGKTLQGLRDRRLDEQKLFNTPVSKELKEPATLRRGDEGTLVALLQIALGITADGIFGNWTEVAVINLQKDAAIEADGIVGPKTWAAVLQRHSA